MPLTRQQLSIKHPDYTAMVEFWAEIDLLYRGGSAIKREAERFLIGRPKEPAAIYQTRLARFSYQNVLGTGLGWYAAKLFSEQIQYFLRRDGGEPVNDPQIEQFVQKADRAGQTLQDLAKAWFIHGALDGAVYVMLDLPRQRTARTLAEQRSTGELDPFAVTFTARQVINWDVDEAGEFNWLVIHTSSTAPAVPGEERKSLDRWLILTRTEFTIYEAKQGEQEARQVDMGLHATADANRVPVVRIAFPPELWLGDRVHLQVKDLLNEDNALAWKLLMSNLAIPVISGSVVNDNKMISESTWLQLTEGSTFNWTEPGGSNYETSMKRIASLREEIYRQMHLQAQARQQGATPSAQSGYSKEMDLQPAIDVLNGYGALFRGALSVILQIVRSIKSRKALGDEQVSVEGLSFQEASLANVDDATLALEAVPTSPTWKKYVRQRVVDMFAPTLNPVVRKKIQDEIEADRQEPAGDPHPDSQAA